MTEKYTQQIIVYPQVPLDEIKGTITDCEYEVAERINELVYIIREEVSSLDQLSWDEVLIVCIDLWDFTSIYDFEQIYPSKKEQRDNIEELQNVSCAVQALLACDTLKPARPRILASLFMKRFNPPPSHWQMFFDGSFKLDSKARMTDQKNFSDSCLLGFEKAHGRYAENIQQIMAWLRTGPTLGIMTEKVKVDGDLITAGHNRCSKRTLERCLKNIHK